MTQNRLAPDERGTVMTASRPEIEAMIVGLARAGRYRGAGDATRVDDDLWAVPLVFVEPKGPGQDLVLAPRPNLPDLARIFRDQPVAPPWWRRCWPYVTGGVTVALGGLGWAVMTVLGVLATYGQTILGFIACVSALYAAAVAKTGCPGLHCLGCSCSR
jgi:hypothetical protein